MKSRVLITRDFFMVFIQNHKIYNSKLPLEVALLKHVKMMVLMTNDHKT